MAVPAAQHDAVDLQARCEACSALCCVTHPFDAGQGFGFDKPAHTPCTHLQDDFRCGIHAGLRDAGFGGCVSYSCHGAGQRVTKLYGEVNWRVAPSQAQVIYAVFSQMKTLHELQWLLSTAYRTVTDAGWQRRLGEQRDRVEAQCRKLEQQQREISLDDIREQTHILLRQLATQPAIIALRASQTSGA